MAVLGSHQPWENLQSTSTDCVIMIPTAEDLSAKFDHSKPSTVASVFRDQLLQDNDAMGKALNLKIAVRRGEIVEQDDSALTAGEKLFECQDLPPVAQRISRQQTQL